MFSMAMKDKEQTCLRHKLCLYKLQLCGTLMAQLKKSCAVVLGGGVERERVNWDKRTVSDM